MKRVLLRVLWWAALVWGGLLAGVLVGVLAKDFMHLFLADEYEHFWDDAVAYCIREPGHKSRQQLEAEYGHEAVDLNVGRALTPAMVPSEKSTIVFWLGNAIKEDETGRVYVYEGWRSMVGGMFLLFYFPVLLAVDTAARWLTRPFCRTERARRLHREHFYKPWPARVGGWLLALPAVAALAGWNAWELHRRSPQLADLGFSLPDLVLMFMAMAYMAGLGVRAASHVIDGALIAFGVDPDKTFLNELAAALVTAPVLVLVFQNSGSAVAADLAAGLAPVVLAKALGWRDESVGRLVSGTADRVGGAVGEALAPRKLAAAWLAVFFGALGAHKFFLGFYKAGAIMLAVTLLTFGMGALLTFPVGVVEGVIYLTKSRTRFHQDYVAGRRSWF